MNLFIKLILIAASVRGVEIDCIFQLNTWAISEATTYSCHSTVILEDGSKILMKVNGQHMVDKSNDDVEALLIDNNNCPFVPKEIDKFFPNLIFLRFAETNLKSISNEDLRPFHMLTHFVSTRNPIEVLDANLFEYNSDLRWIFFGSNQLKFVGHSLFDPLPNLQHAQFSSNVCIDTLAQTFIEIDEIKKELAFNCPSLPAFKLIESEIIGGINFKNSVDARFDALNSELLTTVKELKQHFDDIVIELSETQSLLGETRQELTDTANELQIQNNELNENLTETRKELNEVIKQLTVTKEHLTERTNGLEEQVTDSVEQLTEVRQQLVDITAHFENRYNGMQQQMTDTMQELSNNRQQITDLSELVEERNNELEQQVADTNEQLNIARNELTETREQMMQVTAHFERRNNELQQQIDTILAILGK